MILASLNSLERSSVKAIVFLQRFFPIVPIKMRTPEFNRPHRYLKL